MKAIILSSGMGKRLMPLTEKTPKSLVEINGVTLLERIIQSLIENRVTEIIITTGSLEEKIKEFIKNKYPNLQVTYVKNPIYDKTNYIYSLWLAKDAIKDDDVILIHGDLICDPELIKKVIKSKESCVLIKNGEEIPEKDFKARIQDGLVKEIGVRIFGPSARFCPPCYKILKIDFERWLDKIEEFIKENKINCYAEDALNVITNDIKLHPLYYQNEACMEIDDFDDLKTAKILFKKNDNK